MSNTLTAVLWMLGAVASFTAMAIAGREAAVELDTFELMMYRSIVGVILVLLVGGIAGSLNTISRNKIRLHFIRNICHFFGQNLWFFAVAVIPFAQVFAFEFSTPIWVALLAPFFLGEKLTKIRLLTVLIGFVGILFVAQPGKIVLSSGVIAAALCAIGFAGTFIATKLLSKTESPTCIMFWLAFMQLIFGVICSFYDGDVAIPTMTTIPLIILVGICGLLAHYCIITALKYAPVMIIAPVDFLRLPIIAFIGASFYSEAINFWVIAGAVIVFCANFLNLWGESKAKSQS